MTFEEDLKAAIADHTMWKARLEHAIDTRTCDVPVTTVRSDNHCPFGRLLHRMVRDPRRDAHCDKVLRLHARFHQEAADVLKLALSGRDHAARDALGATSGFGQTSFALTIALQEWLSKESKHAA